MTINAGKFKFSQQALQEFLRLPGAFVYGAEFDPEDQSVILHVKHPNLHQVNEGAVIPFVALDVLKGKEDA